MLSTRRKAIIFGSGGLILVTFIGAGIDASNDPVTEYPSSPSSDGPESRKKTESSGPDTKTKAPEKPTPKKVKSDPNSLRDEINRLRVADELYGGYDYEHFGYNSSSVRADLAIDEMRTDGNYLSPWDGKVYSGTDKMDADHTVALAEAWGSGAKNWSPSKRAAYANNTDDPYVINFLTSGVNRGVKSDNDPAEWLPSKNRCVYVKQWVKVKLKYDLSVDPAEKSALLSASCKGAEKLGKGTVVVPPPPPPPADVPDKDSGGSVYYDNCDAVREAGAAPLLRGQPGYESPRLDRDGDGSACGSD